MPSSVNELSRVVKDFLERNWNRSSPLLVAYSGGPDSKALLYAALEWGKANLQVIHADHGWRAESRSEAMQLELEVKRLGLPFHMRRLPPSHSEEEARTFRLAYFREVQSQQGGQAVLLGHQADDLTETVLKRVFEGAHLTALTGMREISLFEGGLPLTEGGGSFAEEREKMECLGVTLWRPLLSISREQINAWLKERGLEGVFDPTNQDPRYLRARMRSDLVPFLNKTFGKNITQNMLCLSERSYELYQYLKSKNQDRIKRGPFGVWIDGTGLPRLELRFLVQQELKISRALLEPLLDWMEQKVANRVVSSRIALDRGHLFLLNERLPLFERSISLPLEGEGRSGDWVVEEGVGGDKQYQSGLEALWKGELLVPCPQGRVLLTLPPVGLRWKEKTPAFLRRICPVIQQNKKILGSCFLVRCNDSSRWIKLKIEHK